MPLLPLEEPHRARMRLILETTGLLGSDKVAAIGSAAAGRTGARSRTAGAASAASSVRA
jgi:hypothetical protein